MSLKSFTVEIDGINLTYAFNMNNEAFEVSAGTLVSGNNNDLDTVANTLETVIGELATADKLCGAAVEAVAQTWRNAKSALAPTTSSISSMSDLSDLRI